jgi:hypothetical protein
MLEETDIKRFQKLYRLRFGVPIDHDNARKKLALLVEQMELIYQPVTTMQVKEHVNEDVKNEQSGSGRTS